MTTHVTRVKFYCSLACARMALFRMRVDCHTCVIASYITDTYMIFVFVLSASCSLQDPIRERLPRSLAVLARERRMKQETLRARPQTRVKRNWRLTKYYSGTRDMEVGRFPLPKFLEFFRAGNLPTWKLNEVRELQSLCWTTI